jgi:hypothetical protein
MNVRLRVLFKAPGAEEEGAMHSAARRLTGNPDSVRVYAEEAQPGWLVAEFTMPTEAQYRALPKIEREIRLSLWRRLDVRIGFPMTEAERQRADRKAERRRARRRAAAQPDSGVPGLSDAERLMRRPGDGQG